MKQIITLQNFRTRVTKIKVQIVKKKIVYIQLSLTYLITIFVHLILLLRIKTHILQLKFNCIIFVYIIDRRQASS